MALGGNFFGHEPRHQAGTCKLGEEAERGREGFLRAAHPSLPQKSSHSDKGRGGTGCRRFMLRTHQPVKTQRLRGWASRPAGGKLARWAR